MGIFENAWNLVSNFFTVIFDWFATLFGGVLGILG